METLGSLCDKLAIMKVKQWHTTDPSALEELERQENDLKQEINEFVSDAASGLIPAHRLRSRACKVHPQLSVGRPALQALGDVFSQLAWVNLQLWHEVDKSYHIDEYPEEDKTALVKNLASLNLDRNRYKEAIDEIFCNLCAS